MDGVWRLMDVGNLPLVHPVQALWLQDKISKDSRNRGQQAQKQRVALGRLCLAARYESKVGCVKGKVR